MKTEVSPTVEVTPANDLLAALQERTSRRTMKRSLASIRRDHQRVVRQYAHGLPAEAQSARALCAHLRGAARGAIAARTGRRIDLDGLLAMRRADGSPVWALVDPRRPIDHYNGRHDTDGTTAWPRHDSTWYRYIPYDDKAKRLAKSFIPDGMPALPKRVRALIKSPRVKRLATRVGVLYEPTTWREVKPDPALIVEWKDLPGEFYALAVWGGDRARIMEWVH